MELQLLVSWFVLGFPFGSFGRSDFPSLTGLLSSSTSAASFVAMVIDFYNGYQRDGFCRCSPLCSSKGCVILADLVLYVLVLVRTLFYVVVTRYVLLIIFARTKLDYCSQVAIGVALP
jgi:hypothetical protein